MEKQIYKHTQLLGKEVKVKQLSNVSLYKLCMDHRYTILYIYVYVFIIDDRVSCGFLPALPP